VVVGVVGVDVYDVYDVAGWFAVVVVVAFAIIYGGCWVGAVVVDSVVVADVDDDVAIVGGVVWCCRGFGAVGVVIGGDDDNCVDGGCVDSGCVDAVGGDSVCVYGVVDVEAVATGVGGVVVVDESGACDGCVVVGCVGDSMLGGVVACTVVGYCVFAVVVVGKYDVVGGVGVVDGYAVVVVGGCDIAVVVGVDIAGGGVGDAGCVGYGGICFVVVGVGGVVAANGHDVASAGVCVVAVVVGDSVTAAVAAGMSGVRHLSCCCHCL